MKIFGIELFKSVNKGDLYFGNAVNELRNNKELPDFYAGRSSAFSGSVADQYTVVMDSTSTTMGSSTADYGTKIYTNIPKGKKQKKKIVITPKEVFTMKLLNDKSFKLNTNPQYVDMQLSSFKDRLSLLKTTRMDMENGSIELQSMVIRLENRKKYPQYSKYFEQFPYTKTQRINIVLKAHDYLKMGKIEQFLADVPKEAVDIMTEYKKQTIKLCSKSPLFYIIAHEDDFKKTDKRKDPILLAQSPFGHFWQILGAWDEEMLLLSDL